MKTKTAYFNYLVNGISLTSKDADNCSHSGAWDEIELQDHKSNLMRIIWIAAGNIKDDN